MPIGTGFKRRRCPFMPPADPPGTDPEDRDRRENDLARRGRQPTASPWTIILVIALIAAIVFAASALLG
ncbi:hypothetical protein [Brevundimonas lutea]|uniref:hypothetical protein n=1 Tax=Brevundimonas lutea TaxID=2293980 RepID=UPI0013CEEEA9|nr:hypothetical protein [Brevundimonas lutea]